MAELDAPALTEAPPATSPEAPPLILEFTLTPETAARLPRHAAIMAARAGRKSRAVAEELMWLDTPDGVLAGRGVALEAPRRGPRRQLLLDGDPATVRLPGTPPLVLAAPPEDIAGLAPVSAFSGRRIPLPLGPGEAPLQGEILTGKLRAVAAERPVARLRLAGEGAPVLDLARRLSADLPLMPAAIDLPSEGRALARGETVRARRHGPPDLGRARSVEDALVAAIGHLTEVMLHHAPLCRIEAGPNGVHQMRVALRRLRSVLKAFRPAAACDAVEAFDLSLKTLAQTLGDARDLDVFLLGIGTRVSAAMPGERRIATLLRAMEARRAGAYQALRAMLEGQQFRALMLDGIALMLERPWSAAALDRPDQAELLAERLPDFASRLLDKRWHRLCSEGEAIETMDEEALHELRLSTKRLRYAAELFAPIWPGKPCKRFLSRLAAVQEEFGLANDAAVARGIVAALGTSVPAWAVGVIEGFSAARAGSARRKGYSAWKDLMAAKPFWSEL